MDPDEGLDYAEEEIKDLRVLLEKVLYAQLGGHLSPNETGKAVLDMIRKHLYPKLK